VTLSFAATQFTTGTPQVAGTITVQTSQDRVSTTATLTALGGQVSVGTTLTLTSADQVGGQATAGVVTMVFTPPSGILLNGVITINTPHNYFATAAAAAAVTGGVITCSTACGTVTMGNVEVQNVAATATEAAYGRVTVAVTGAAITTANGAVTLSFAATQFTTGTPQVAGTITVQTSQDRVSTTAVFTALGGQVSVAKSLTFVNADLRGNWENTAPATLVFTPPSGILLNGVITITVPYNVFKTKASAAAVSGTTLTCATSCASVTVGNVAVLNVPAVTTPPTAAAYGTITVAVTGAAITTANGAVTLTFAAGSLSTSTAQIGGNSGITVSTSQDRASLGALLQSTDVALCPISVYLPKASAFHNGLTSFLLALSILIAFYG